MFEATMTQVVVLRKIVESLKDLVTEVNIEATPTGRIRHLNLYFKVCLSKLWTAPMSPWFLYNSMNQDSRIIDVTRLLPLEST